MIKVVVTDMDGTLLNERHEVSKRSLAAINKLYENNIRFIISTGRHYKLTMDTLEKYKLKCDYIVASGAEIRDENAKILKQIPMDHSNFQEILEKIKDFPIAVRFCSDDYDYVIGSQDSIKRDMLLQAKYFFDNSSFEEIEASSEFQKRLSKVKGIKAIEELKEQEVAIYKIFIFSEDDALIEEIDNALSTVEGIASASSFTSNLELTHINAQKGIALKEYIEGLGYSMEEIMVLGDSMNDYSMLSMDFGATVAMENGMEKIKEVSKYMTKSNIEEGFAYAVEKMLLGELEDLRINK